MIYEKVINAIKDSHKELGLMIRISSIVSEYLGAEKANFLLEKEGSPIKDIKEGILFPIETQDNRAISAWHILNGPKELSPEQKAHIHTIGHLLVLSLQNIMLREQIIIDSLTRLYNRSYLDLRLNEEIEKSKRYNTPFSLLMLDIDHFKNFNDTYGHQTGDEVLRLVAKVLRNNTRASDLVFRYGGEEFAVYLHNITRQNANKVAQRLMEHINATIDTAERLRETVKQSPLVQSGKPIPVTVSIGITAFKGGNKGLTIEETIKRADESLYRAKQAGRDRSEVVGRHEEFSLLIVDDEEDYTTLLSDYFGKRGYHVMTAQNGEKALELLGKHKFDIMLLDLKMPGMSGLDVLQRLSDIKKQMRVLILSVVQDEEVKKLGYTLGACEFLQKPISIEYLNKHLMARVLEMKT